VWQCWNKTAYRFSIVPELFTFLSKYYDWYIELVIKKTNQIGYCVIPHIMNEIPYQYCEDSSGVEVVTSGPKVCILQKVCCECHGFYFDATPV
jgi:hypothetical protein